MVHRFFGSGRGALLALAALSLASESAALGFCRTTTCAVKSPPPSCVRDLQTGCWTSGIPLTWPQPCVSYSVNQAASPALATDYSDALLLAAGAFALWPNAMCGNTFPSIAVKSLGPVTCDRVEYHSTGPNANVIVFRDSGWPYDDTSQLALTTVTFNRSTGEILDADMEINTFDHQLNAHGIAFAMAHEAGHFMGLDHSPLSSALMYFSAPDDLGLVDPALSSDDVAAICEAYPISRPVSSVCDFAPPKGFASDCGGNLLGGGCAVASAAEERSTAGPSRGGVAIAAAGLGVAFVGVVVRRRRRHRRGPPRAARE